MAYAIIVYRNIGAIQKMEENISKINYSFLQELQRAKKEGYICPICGSGGGSKGTGITTKDGGAHYTCWRGCFTNASPVDILAQIAGIDPKDNKAAIENACKHFGIDTSYYSIGALERIKRTEKDQKQTAEPAAAPDFESWHKALMSFPDGEANKALNYLASRHIKSLPMIGQYKLGYAELNGNEYIIFPTGPSSYNARNINKGSENRYYKTKGQPSEIFNIAALDNAQEAVFITEGEIDALSFIEIGYQAIGLGGLGNLKKAIERARQAAFKYPLIIALDNDESGIKAQEALQNEADIYLYKPDLKALYNGKKDANEALVDHHFSFEEDVKAVFNEATASQAALADEARQKAIEQIQKDSVAAAQELFEQTIERNKTAPFIPTGYKDLDGLLDGGLFAGLYIIGAISSLGKTTFCIQMADQIAYKGQDVLIFSLEMSKVELMAKSISRLTSEYDQIKYNSLNDAKTTRGILTGGRGQNYSEAEKDVIAAAKDHYFRNVAPHLFIYEGVGTIGARQVRERVKNFTELTGKAPVVIIDYLQILAAPEDKYLTDKQAIDQNVMELKRISRDYEIPVIGVSSFNRENYNAPVNMTAFKESGAIEYSSDVLIGLQYKEMKELGEDPKANKNKAAEIFNQINEKAAKREPIAVQVKVLKNRNGRKGEVDIAFLPLFNRFDNAALYSSL